MTSEEFDKIAWRKGMKVLVNDGKILGKIKNPVKTVVEVQFSHVGPDKKFYGGAVYTRTEIFDPKEWYYHTRIIKVIK